MAKAISSVFDNEIILLKAILDLHCGGHRIQLDPMYFKGNFYKEGIEKPLLKFDIRPQGEGCLQANASNLPIGAGMIGSMILDPPFMFEIRKRKNKNYGANTHGLLKGFRELEELYKGILQEAYRILKKKGILLFKCQDYTDSKTTMTHCLVYNWAVELGFYAKDIAILYKPKNKIYNPNLKQRHFRKMHTYFWVFEKR